jgi:hypothetical protein
VNGSTAWWFAVLPERPGSMVPPSAHTLVAVKDGYQVQVQATSRQAESLARGAMAEILQAI